MLLVTTIENQPHPSRGDFLFDSTTAVLLSLGRKPVNPPKEGSLTMGFATLD
jgi:hypothetical protein